MTRRRSFAPLLAAVTLAATACSHASSTISVSGTVEIREIALAPLAAGRLLELRKDEGDSVRAGDTVAILDQPGLDALIAQRRAQASAAATRTAEVSAALADSARAADDLARARPLRQQGIVSAQQFDGLASAVAGANARLAAARASGAESDAARAGLAQARSILDQLTVIAPASGVILARYADPGEVLGAGTPVVSLGVVSQPWVRAYVGDRDVAAVRVGSPATVRADGDSRVFTGRVTEISPRAEFTPRAALTERERADLVFGIKVTVDDTSGHLKAGMPVTVELPRRP
ncbi:MAG TPA: efflux RND transporter periplasmic adaptor subunit [Gemmatimonadales bacterium]|nr:efflux RND transporter periplasmic adaptor subunit [Gemmatimonadales bacterium]